jgi:hypothetical protein
MLDEMPALIAAAQSYRAAAADAGVAWPDGCGTPVGPPPDLVYRIFDVDQFPKQLTWLQSQGWHSRMLFPDGGDLLPWPTRDTAVESLNLLSRSVGVPFHWRHQIPLFRFDFLVYTFVLAHGHEGEIWRYMIDVDTWDPVRAAFSLTSLFTQWTSGITAGAIYYRQTSRWLVVGDPSGAPQGLDVLRQRAPELDPMAFPLDLSMEPVVLERQLECGVDLDRLDLGFDSREELQDEVDAVCASLGL